MFLQHNIMQVIYQMQIQNFSEHAPVKLLLILHDRRTKQQVDGFIKHSVCACVRVCACVLGNPMRHCANVCIKAFPFEDFFLIQLHKKHKLTHAG